MRFIYGDSGTVSDITKKIQSYSAGAQTFSYVATEDYLYIGADLPFNHIYFKLGGTVNALAAEMVVETWNGVEWIEAVEVIDETSVAGASLAQSGHVEFTPDREESWPAESTNDDGESIPELEDLVIYDLYWARVSFDADLTPAVVLNWMGHIFSNDSDLYGEFPVFNDSVLLGSFAVGKTTWEEQHVRAAELVIQDLKAKQILIGGEQILRRDDYRLASLQKAAQLIFGSMGDDYIDDMEKARKEYAARLSLSIHPVDKNRNAILDPKEKESRTGWFSR